MSIMQIYFLVDPSGLTKGCGSFGDPTPYPDGHPPIQYGYRGRSLTHANGNTPVPVRQGDSVNIYAIQAGGIVDGRPVIEPRLEIAPVRVIAMTWTPTGGDKQDASQALMTGGQAPIDELTFAIHDIFTYGAKYIGCRQDWQENGEPFCQYARGGSNSGQDATVEKPSLQRPYITFEVGQEVTGLFQFGLEIRSWMDGKPQSSVWWDPKLQINLWNGC